MYGDPNSQVEPIMVFVFGVIFFALFWLPVIIAMMRRRPAAAILLVNLFFGWTIIGWIIALIWSVTEPNSKQRPA